MDTQDFDVYLAQTDDGRWLAATNHAPYFCFEAATQEELRQVVSRGIDFWLKNRGAVSRSPDFNVSITRFRPTARVPSREFVLA